MNSNLSFQFHNHSVGRGGGRATDESHSVPAATMRPFESLWSLPRAVPPPPSPRGSTVAVAGAGAGAGERDTESEKVLKNESSVAEEFLTAPLVCRGRVGRVVPCTVSESSAQAGGLSSARLRGVRLPLDTRLQNSRYRIWIFTSCGLN